MSRARRSFKKARRRVKRKVHRWRVVRSQRRRRRKAARYWRRRRAREAPGTRIRDAA